MLDVLVFAIDGSRYGVPLPRVVEVAPRVALRPLPGVSEHIRGAFVYRGAVALAVDGRLRLGHPARRPLLEDHLIVTRGRRRPIAVIVDRVEGVRALDPAAIAPPPSSAAVIDGLVVAADGLLVLDDLDAVLDAEDERAAEDALGGRDA